MMDHTRVKLILACALFGAVSASVNTAVAQGDAEFFDDALILEEIIINARKRQQSRQGTPGAITTLSSESLQEAGISQTSDLQQAIPGIVFQQTGSKNPTIFVRGVGQRESTAIFDPGVGVYINGVYMPRADAHLLDTIDTQAIDVLRGPQGTSFGKNTTGGAILINTKKPHSDKFEGFSTVRAGNLGREDAKVSVNIPIASNFAVRAGINSVKRDGYMVSLADGKRYGDEARVAATGRALWEINERLDADLFLYYSRQNENGAPYTCFWIDNDDALLAGFQFIDPSISTPQDFLNNSNAILAGNPLSYENHCKRSEALADKDKVLLSAKSKFEMSSQIISGTFRLAINDNLEAKAIVAWSRQQDIVIQDDQDAVDLDIFYNGTLSWNDALERIGVAPGEEERDQVSVELRINGTAMQDSLSFTLGGFYAKENLLNNPFSQSIGTNGFAAQLRSYTYDNGIDPAETHWFLTSVNTYLGKQNDLDNESFGAFAQATYDFNEWLSVTAGLRYSIELREREVSIYRFNKNAMKRINETLAANLGSDLQSVYGTGELAVDWLGLPNPDPLITNNYGFTTDERPLIFTLVDNVGQIVELNESGSIDPTALAAVTNLFYEYARQARYISSDGQALAGPDQYTDDEEFTDISPMLTVSVRVPPHLLKDSIADSALFYGTYSEGFKAGGLEPRTSRGDRLTVFEPEEVANLEFGFKLDALRSKLRVNGAFYYLAYDNIQLRIAEQIQDQLGAVDLYVGNAAEASITGAELEVFVTPTPSLVLAFTTNFMKAEYDEFVASEIDATGNVVLKDRSDEDFYGIPELTYTVMASYNWITEYGLFIPRISGYYKDEVFIGVDSSAVNYEQSYLDDYMLWNARFTWVPATMDNVATTLFVNNIMDEEHYLGGFAVPATAGTATAVKGPPRAVGLELIYNF